MTCAAERSRDGGYYCAGCRMQWDADDERPECRAKAAAALGPMALGVAMLDAARTVDEPRFPVELPLELARRMATAFRAAGSQLDEEPQVAADMRGMRAAWRVFLDSNEAR